MADALALIGTLTATPNAAGGAVVAVPVDERNTLTSKTSTVVSLTGDAPVSLDLGGVAAAHVLFLKVSKGSKVKASITTADGAAQVVPVDGFMALFCKAAGVTALSLTRTVGVDTTVEVFLGEMV